MKSSNLYFAVVNKAQETKEILKGELIRELDFRGKHYFFVKISEVENRFMNEKYKIDGGKYARLLKKYETTEAGRVVAEIETEVPKKAKRAKKDKSVLEDFEG